MRAVIGIGMCLALAACGKPAPTQVAPAQAPNAPQVRIGQVGATVFAPTISGTGTVEARAPEVLPGAAVRPPAFVASGQTNGYALHLALPAAEAARLTLGATAQIQFAAFQDDIIVGRVIGIAPPAGGTVAVELALPRDDARLKAGQVGTARIIATGAGTTFLAVPPSAVMGPHTGAAAVFVVDLATSLVHRRAVLLGADGPDGIGVTAGLRKGEWVALTRPDQLKEGMKIAPFGPSQ